MLHCIWRIRTPHFYTEGEKHLNGKIRKILASFSALLVLTSVLVTGMNVFAWTDGPETYDYGFTSGSYDNGLVGRLAADFEAYKYVDIDKEGGTTAVYGPKKPGDQNPDKTSNIGIWTTAWYGSYSNGALKPSTTINGDKGYSALTYTTKRLTDFKMQYTATGSYARIGIAFGGEKGVFPVSLDGNDANDTGVMIFCEAEGHLGVGGAIDTDTATVNGNLTIQKKPGGHTLQNSASVRIPNFAPNCKSGVTVGSAADAPDYTLCIKVVRGMLTIYEKSTPNVVFSVKLTDKYQGGYVSLFSNNAGQGAFKAFGVSAIEFADCTALDAQLARLDGLTLSNYTDETATAVQTLTAQADSMRAKLKSEQADVDAFTANLETAIDALTPKPGDFTALNAALDSIPENLDNYTADSVAALNTAKAAAEDAKAKNILQQAEIDAAAAALKAAVDALTLKPADITALEAALAAVPSDLTIYTDESIRALSTAQTAAEAAKSFTILQQSEADAAAATLEAAVDALALKGADTTALVAALLSIPENLNNYTADSVAALNTAKAAAEAAQALDILHQSEADAAAAALKAAVDALVLKPADLTALKAVLATVPTDLAAYTDESVATLNAAKAKAETAVAAAPDITKQAEIDALTTALQNAVKGLTVKTNGGSNTGNNGNTGNTDNGNTGNTDNSGSPATPTTGDSMPQIAFMVLALLSALGLTVAVIAKKRERA